MNDLIMSDEQILQQVNHCIENGIVMNLTLMERGLRVQRQLIEKLQADHKTLVTGLVPLSKRQIEVFDFIKDHVEKHGYAPSVRDTAKAVYLSSSSSVQRYIDILVKKGYIRRKGVRAIEIIGKREEDANAVRGNRSSD